VNRDDIIRMAHEAGFSDIIKKGVWITDGCWDEELERFANLVAAAEREACMKLCKELSERKVLMDGLTKGEKMRCRSAEAGARRCFVLIRARNKQGE